MERNRFTDKSRVKIDDKIRQDEKMKDVKMKTDDKMNMKKVEEKSDKTEKMNMEKEVGKSEKSDVIEIPVGKQMEKLRSNPWIISTFVLGIVLVLVLVFGGVGYKGGGEEVVSLDEAENNLLSFIKSQSQVPADLEVISSEKEGQLYKVTLNFQGQEVPVYVSLDGKYLIADRIPLDLDAIANVGDNNLDDGNNLGDANSGGVVDVDISGSPAKGDANAPVVMVEFSDYQCPFCARFYTETLGLIEKDYIDTGKVKLVYKDFPLSFHPEAQKAAEAARCVGAQSGDDGYWEMHDLLFENQQELSEAKYKEWARSIKGINGAKFDTCLDSGEFEDEVLSDFAYGQQIGITGTPGFFINGKLVSGAQPYSVFKQLIDAELGV